MNLERLGRVAFYVGLVISLGAGFIDLGSEGLLALVILGVVIGALNVTGAEIQKFLLATVALLLVVFITAPLFGAFIQTIAKHFIAFVAGAAGLVALREVYEITKKQ